MTKYSNLSQLWLKNTLNTSYFARKAFWLSALILSTVFTGCKKEDSALGSTILPDSDQLNAVYTDTFSLFTYSTLEDSVRTDNTLRRLEQNLGNINDPIFGVTTATLANQYRFTGSAADLGNPSDLVLDSVVLYLEVLGHYGKGDPEGPLDPQTLIVHEITQKLDPANPYYSSDSVSYDPTPIGKVVNYKINTRDSSTIGQTKTPPLIRIPLSAQFGNRILQASQSSDLSSNENFIEFMKGLLVKSENSFTSGNGALVQINISSNSSRLSLYYTNTATSTSTSFDFFVNSSAARINLYRHNYSDSPVESTIDNKTGNEHFYVQSLQGVKGVFEIPWLENLRDKRIIINKAEVILPVDLTGPGSNYMPPHDRLVLVAKGEDNNNLITSDMVEGDGYVGGNFDPVKKQYYFNIAREVNAILSGTKENNGFYIVPAGGAYLPNRTVLFGAQNPNTTPKLVVYYTKF